MRRKSLLRADLLIMGIILAVVVLLWYWPEPSPKCQPGTHPEFEEVFVDCEDGKPVYEFDRH